MKKIIEFFEALSLARAIIKKRTYVFEKTYFGTEERSKAITAYRSIWPKTPLMCCDDSHEAGFVHGYYMGMNRDLK